MRFTHCPSVLTPSLIVERDPGQETDLARSPGASVGSAGYARAPVTVFPGKSVGEDIELQREGSQALTFKAMLAVGFSFFALSS